jgi:hypothetical protein
MVPAIREARARGVGTSLLAITAPGTEFLRPETRPRTRHIPPPGDRIAKARIEYAALTLAFVAKSLGSEIEAPGRTRTSNQTVMGEHRNLKKPVNPDESEDD